MFRARVTNPRWIASMTRQAQGRGRALGDGRLPLRLRRHDGVDEDWMDEQVAASDTCSMPTSPVMTRSNPSTAHTIAERLLEAADRGLSSTADDATLAEIRERYLALEGELEEARHVSRPYPFSAIVGQEELREALLVNAVSPEVGGVLVRGERGTAKSTAVRALAPLLPPVPAAAGRAFAFAPGDLAPDGRGATPTQRRRARRRRSSSCRSARRSTASSARSTSGER